jgi:hypothetical protein
MPARGARLGRWERAFGIVGIPAVLPQHPDGVMRREDRSTPISKGFEVAPLRQEPRHHVADAVVLHRGADGRAAGRGGRWRCRLRYEGAIDNVAHGWL